MSKTITRLYDTYSDASAAVRELEAIGVPRDDISVIAHDEHEGLNDDGDVSRGTAAGAAMGGAGGLLAGLGLLAIPGLGPIVAAGWLAATAVGAGVGAAGGAVTGGIVGALKTAGHSEEDANIYSEAVRRGGKLVSARVADADVVRAEAVLDRVASVNIAERGASYRSAGWSAFDANAPAYTRDEIDKDRGSHGIPARY